jgi:hypothetical protein
LTDLRVRDELGLVPLAVAADRIALPALRCSGLLDELGVIDRSGVDGVFEVYPAAALKAWGLPYRKYKQTRSNNQAAKLILADLFQKVCLSCPWLNFSNQDDRLLCSQDDDAFDALIASLVAQAAALGRTACPLEADALRAQVEGWIAIPKPQCQLGELWSSYMGSGAAWD